MERSHHDSTQFRKPRAQALPPCNGATLIWSPGPAMQKVQRRLRCFKWYICGAQAFVQQVSFNDDSHRGPL